MAHANAALTPKHRLRLARLIVDDGWPPSRAAEFFHVSWRTATKWAQRYREEGSSGMVDRSSARHSQHARTPQPVVRKIVYLRWKQRLGPVPIAAKLDMTNAEVAWGICNIVNENMAAAARIHIAEKGHDPREFTMVATGGAGPVHVVEVARKLQIPRVLATIAAGAGSCLGLLAAPARVDRSWSNPALVKDVDWKRLATVYDELRADAESELASAGAAGGKIQWWIGAEMRYAGQGHNVSVSLPWRKIGASLCAALMKEFESRYRQLYGHLVPNAAPQVITWRLTGRSVVRSHRFTWGDARVSPKPVMRGKREIYLSKRGRYGAVPVYERYSLKPGTRLAGPLVLEERESTLVVPVVADVRVLPDYTVSVTIKEF